MTAVDRQQQIAFFDPITKRAEISKSTTDYGYPFFPPTIRGRNTWHLISEKKPVVPRAFIVAELKHGGVWHYFIELERKGAALALQHIRAQDGNPIDRNTLSRFMIDVAVEAGWNARKFYTNWIFARIIHRSTDRIDRLAQAIIKNL